MWFNSEWTSVCKKKKISEEVLRTRTALLTQELPRQQITVKLKHVSISLYPHFAL